MGYQAPAAVSDGVARDCRLPLRVGISMRALFNLEAEHAIFETQGVEAYVDKLRDLETTRMEKGVAFEAVSRLLRLNAPGQPPCVEAVLLSRNAPEASLRAFASIDAYGLKIRAGSFTSGGAVAPLLGAFGIDLFLSKDAADVEAAHAAGIAAAKFGGDAAWLEATTKGDDVRIAFDGDAVVFSDESEQVYLHHGLQSFLRHEVAHARKPMAAGPFEAVLRKLAGVRTACRAAGRPNRLRIALVTARTAPAHARMIHTLRAWGLEVDEAHFVGEADKGRVLAAFGAHVFFDDQVRHVASASSYVASGHVPGRGGLRSSSR